MKRFQPDMIIGALILSFSLCGSICGIGVGLGIGMIGLGSGAAATTTSPVAGLGIAALGAGLAAVIIVYSLFSLVLGAGILMSKRWGLLLGACFFGLAGVGAILSMGGDGFLSTIINLALFAYCFCRITGKIGPEPLR